MNTNARVYSQPHTLVHSLAYTQRRMRAHVQVRFVPQSEGSIERIFSAFNACALLNPDAEEGVLHVHIFTCANVCMFACLHA